MREVHPNRGKNFFTTVVVLRTIAHTTQTFKKLSCRDIDCGITVCRLCFGANDRAFTKDGALDSLGSICLSWVPLVSQFNVDPLRARIKLRHLCQFLLDVFAEVGVNLCITCSNCDVHGFSPHHVCGLSRD